MRAVLFDLDDTLHDKSATLRLVAEHQYGSFSLREQNVDLAQWVAAYVDQHNQLIPKTQVFDFLTRQFRLDFSSAQPMLEEYDRECGGLAQPFPGAEMLLAACRQDGIALGCVTNGRDSHQRSKIVGMGLETYFASIVTSGAFGAKKPALSIFKHCLDELGVRPCDCIFVGDNFAADMAPALKLGMQTIWKSAEHSDEVDFCSNSLDAIRSYLFC